MPKPPTKALEPRGAHPRLQPLLQDSVRHDSHAESKDRRARGTARSQRRRGPRALELRTSGSCVEGARHPRDVARGQRARKKCGSSFPRTAKRWPTKVSVSLLTRPAPTTHKGNRRPSTNESCHRKASSASGWCGSRVNQHFFRAAILAAYENLRCCITGLAVPGLLVASHIVPWARDTETPHESVQRPLLECASRPGIRPRTDGDHWRRGT